MKIRNAQSFLHRFSVVVVLLTMVATVIPQSLNPPWLSQMPEPSRVLNEIKGKDAEDTIERQMGAFMVLNKMIDAMAYGLEHRFMPTKQTPDEYKMKEKYGYAYADLWHKAARKEDHKYDNDFELRNEMLAKMFSKEFRDLWAKSDASGDAYREAARARNSGVLMTVGPTNSAPAKSEFEQLCSAKGLDPVTCFVQSGLKGAMRETESEYGQVPGLRIHGAYQSGNFRISLTAYRAAWVNCGDVFLMSEYVVERKNDLIVLHIKNEQNPFTLTLRADGSTLVGPASIPIHGHAPGGGGGTTSTAPGAPQQVQTTQQRTLTPLEAQQYPNAVKNGQTYTVNETTTSTEYAPVQPTQMAAWPAKTAPCKVGVLPVVVAPPNKAEDALAKSLGIEGGTIPNGLRMAGKYQGQGGASIEFFSDKAVLGCNVTLVERPYTVALGPGQVLINLAGGSGAKMFTLKPDGTLAGDNSQIFLNGRRKTGVNALGETTYAPSSDTCGYGVMSAGGKP